MYTHILVISIHDIALCHEHRSSTHTKPVFIYYVMYMIQNPYSYFMWCIYTYNIYRSSTHTGVVCVLERMSVCVFINVHTHVSDMCTLPVLMKWIGICIPEYVHIQVYIFRYTYTYSSRFAFTHIYIIFIHIYISFIHIYINMNMYL